MITLKRINSNDQDFQNLVRKLDGDLAVRDGDDHSYYDQFNKIDAIKYAVVAYENEEAVGCGAIKLFEPCVMEIKRMFVSEDKRGKGIASLILRELEMWAEELKSEKCVLETGYKQPEAIALYRKNGYSQIPNYGQYIGMDNSICFEKSLERTKQNVTIGLATAEDANLLAGLGRETFHDAFARNPLMPQKDLQSYLDTAFTVSQISAELSDPQTVFLLAKIDNEAVGYARLDFGATATGVTGKNPVKLKRLYSRQKFIGSGIGSSLMKRCLEEAKKRSHDTIWLSVWKHNETAQIFYRKWNFTECGTINFQLGETNFLDILMQRTVSDIK